MTPVISPWYFYLFDVVSAIDTLAFCFVLTSGTILAVVLIIALFSLDMFGEEIFKKIIKTIKVFIIVIISSAVVGVICPSQDTLTKMMLAQNITYERINTAADVVEVVYEDILSLFENKE